MKFKIEYIDDNGNQQVKSFGSARTLQRYIQQINSTPTIYAYKNDGRLIDIL